MWFSKKPLITKTKQKPRATQSFDLKNSQKKNQSIRHLTQPNQSNPLPPGLHQIQNQKTTVTHLQKTNKNKAGVLVEDDCDTLTKNKQKQSRRSCRRNAEPSEPAGRSTSVRVPIIISPQIWIWNLKKNASTTSLIIYVKIVTAKCWTAVFGWIWIRAICT